MEGHVGSSDEQGKVTAEREILNLAQTGKQNENHPSLVIKCWLIKSHRTGQLPVSCRAKAQLGSWKVTVTPDPHGLSENYPKVKHIKKLKAFCCKP